MKLNEILHYRPQKGDTKEAALRLLAGLLAVMLLCTLLSRAADAVTMPQVATEKPMQSSITHTVEAQGVLEALSETLVTTREGVLVDSVAAGEGKPVEVGDVLFTLNSESLAKKLRQEQLELQKLRLEMTSRRLNDELAEKRDRLGYERAYEDYSDAFDRSYRSLEDARRARAEALGAMRDYYALHKLVIDRWQGSNAVGVSNVDEADWEIVARYRQLVAEYEAADVVYEAARDSRSEGWKSAERGLQDAELTLEWDTDRQAEIMGLTLAMQEEESKELQRLVEDGGVIRSPVDGVISRMTARAGEATPAGAAAMVALNDGGFRFVAEFTEDDMEYIEFGAAGTISFPNGRPVKVTLDSARGGEVSAKLPEGQGEPGARGVLQISHKGASYPTCVPMSALRSDGNQKYVMVLRETETVLGTQLTAERVDVKLEDNNETRAAVSGALVSTDKVIVSASKPVRAGDKVRLLAQ